MPIFNTRKEQGKSKANILSMEKMEKVTTTEFYIKYNVPDQFGNVFKPGCFDNALKQAEIGGKIIEYKHLSDGVKIITKFDLTEASPK